MKKFLTISFIFCSLYSQAAFYGVFIGISEYNESPDAALPYGVANDAKEIAAFFKNANHDTDYSKITLLTNRNAIKKNVLAAIEKQFTKAKQGDVVLFFFSGHGIPGAYCLHDDFFYYEEIKQLFSKSKAQLKLCFIDSCFSGGIGSSPIGQRNLQETKMQDLIIFSSSRTTEQSLATYGNNKSIFTDCLLKGLKGKADENKDNTITASELFRYVHNTVSSQTNDFQHPVMTGKFDKERVIIRYK